jgi:hypothetical protein
MMPLDMGVSNIPLREFQALRQHHCSRSRPHWKPVRVFYEAGQDDKGCQR